MAAPSSAALLRFSLFPSPTLPDSFPPSAGTSATLASPIETAGSQSYEPESASAALSTPADSPCFYASTLVRSDDARRPNELELANHSLPLLCSFPLTGATFAAPLPPLAHPSVRGPGTRVAAEASPLLHRRVSCNKMGQPYSNADPDRNLKDKWLDKGWPLTRFLGYRPPPADPVAARHWAAGMDHILPAPLRERHRKRRREEQLRKEGTGEGAQNGHSRAAAADLLEGGLKGPSKEGKLEEVPSLGSRLSPTPLCLLAESSCVRTGGAHREFLFVRPTWTGARSNYLRDHDSPLIVAAFGAEAVLLCVPVASVSAHLANRLTRTFPAMADTQHTTLLSFNHAVLGVCVAKLFELQPGFKIGGVAASVSLALALLVMQLFEITHPPGGAVALLAVTISQIAEMGWWYIPMVLQASLIMLGWALLINNVGGRRYPK
ncbi:hypothetical protein C6P46_006385 [Rhodotorula mucilaginosa]|uniref:HPP transmembrane region domain-containing protein n=1 Tax=Rhodotorula mucilaginosa TaxID=5537 RepID=A0A9P6W6M7_RHOMI|nr:hypothetical protein C6P46_006385 [Rhodotorula mucilaginosa]